MQKLFWLPLLAWLAGCRPAPYDELAAGPGHWEWQSTAYRAGRRTPATEGYTRQLTFGLGGRLRLQAHGQLTQIPYTLSVGPLTRCNDPTPVALVTFATHEARLPNNDRKTYTIARRDNRQVLSLTGEEECVDGGFCETYYWVAK